MDAEGRGRRAALIVAITVTLLGCMPAVAAAERRPCPRAATERSSAATLFIRSSSDEEYHELVGCVKATRRRMVLAGWFAQGSSADEPAPQAWLAGRFAAVNEAACPADPTSADPCTGMLRVVDLRARRTRTTVSTGSPIFDLVLTRRGAVGMIHRNELITAVGDDVRVHDREAEQWSMAYAKQAGRLYWTSAGQPRSTTLR